MQFASNLNSTFAFNAQHAEAVESFSRSGSRIESRTSKVVGCLCPHHVATNSQAAAVERKSNTPTLGEPVLPRKRPRFQRSRGSDPTRAWDKSRASKKHGVRSISRVICRNILRNHRSRLNRRVFRTFRSWYLEYAVRRKQHAQETWERHGRHTLQKWKMLSLTKKKRLFEEFKNRGKGKGKPTKMAYNRTVRAATLNVRGLVGETAITKEHLIVDIIKPQRYDIMLLQFVRLTVIFFTIVLT